MRGTRGDLANSISRIGRHVTSWSRADDRRLHRIFQYLACTAEIGVLMFVHAEDASELWLLQGYTDSDHAGDKLTGKSTSGSALIVTRRNASCVPLTWGSRAQNVTANSTGEAEAEAVALNEGLIDDNLDDALDRSSAIVDVMTRAFVQCQEVLAQVWSPQTTLGVAIDNKAAEIAVKGGFSKVMAYIGKYQRVNLGFLRDMFVPKSLRCLAAIPSVLNLSDIHTKPLGPTEFKRLREMCGFVKREDAAIHIANRCSQAYVRRGTQDMVNGSKAVFKNDLATKSTQTPRRSAN